MALVVVLVVAGATALVLLRPRAFVDALAAPAPPTASPSAPPSPAPAPTPAPASPTGFDRTRLPIDDPDSPWVVVTRAPPAGPLDHAPADLVDAGGGHQLRAGAAQAMAASRRPRAPRGCGSPWRAPTVPTTTSRVCSATP